MWSYVNFSCMQPIGPVGEDVSIDEDLPKYIIRGKS
jgi:hypothetical protein